MILTDTMPPFEAFTAPPEWRWEADDREFPKMTRKELTRARDVPASCCCPWDYKPRPAPSQWVRRAAAAGCPWHHGRA